MKLHDSVSVFTSLTRPQRTQLTRPTTLNHLSTLRHTTSCVRTATAKIFSVTHRDDIMSVRQLVNLPRLTEIIEKREQKFMDRLLQLDYFTVVLKVYSMNVFL